MIEAIKCGRSRTKTITNSNNKILETGSTPKDWELAAILSIFKSGDTRLYDNCRGIIYKELSIPENVYERTVEARLRERERV